VRESGPHAEFSQPDPAREELNAMVRERISGLDEQHREAVILHYFVGRSTRGAAELLEISRDALKKRLQRGREALGEALLKDAGDAFRTEEDPKKATRQIMGVIGWIPVAWDGVAVSSAASMLPGLSISAAKFVAGTVAACVLGLAAWFLRPKRTVEEIATPLAPATPSQAFEQQPADAVPEELFSEEAIADTGNSIEQAADDALLQCEVVGANGTAVVGAEASLERRVSSRDPAGRKMLVQRQGRTDDNGEALFEGLPEGVYVVRAQTNEGIAISHANVSHFLRERLVLEPVSVVTGQVENPRGDDHAQARFSQGRHGDGGQLVGTQ
jgi:predicted DNA-binding protein (UPF0251 family)